jgi:hypothetical protein
MEDLPDLDAKKPREKTLEKMKKRATEWHAKRRDVPASERAIVDDEGISTGGAEEAIKRELSIVRELKAVVANSKLERKVVFLSALQSAQELLERGSIPDNLPIVVKNLSRKDEVRDDVYAITKKYRTGGATYFYQWGIGE